MLCVIKISAKKTNNNCKNFFKTNALINQRQKYMNKHQIV